MSDMIRYKGDGDGAKILDAALNAGYQIGPNSLGGPVETTAMWMSARESFSDAQVEAGLPSDLRVIVERKNYGSGKDEYVKEFIRVPTRGGIKFDAGRVLVANPKSQPITPAKDYGGELGVVAINPNLSKFQEVWVDNTTGEKFVAWTWDGSIESFTELVSSFQLNDNFLKKIEVKKSKKSTIPVVEATYYSYRDKHEYTMPFLQGGVYALGSEGNIVPMDRHDPNYRLLEVASEKRARDPLFRFTPFSQEVYANGIDLVPDDKTPWYKNPLTYVAVVAVLALILGLMIWGSSSDSPQSSEVVTEVETTETTDDDTPEDTETTETTETETYPDDVVTDTETTETETTETPSKQPPSTDTDTEVTVDETTKAPEDSSGTTDSGKVKEDVKKAGEAIKNLWDSVWGTETGEQVKDAIDDTVDKVKETPVKKVEVDVPDTEKITSGWLWPWEDGFSWPWEK